MLLKSLDPALRNRLFVGLLLVLSLVLLLSAIRQVQGTPQATKPELGLMTTLPLQWNEGALSAVIDSSAEPDAAFARLTGSYRITPVDAVKQLDAGKVGLLLMAQSRALSAPELVALDAWVRRGGKVLILADPALQWESSYPIGDARRPLFTSMLSPLFSHWGLELVLPVTQDSDKMVVWQVDGLSIRTATPGEWLLQKGDSGASCTISATGLLADCSIGAGRALLVADADLLEGDYWEGTGVRAITGSDDFGNMRWVQRLLGSLRENVGESGE